MRRSTMTRILPSSTSSSIRPRDLRRKCWDERPTKRFRRLWEECASGSEISVGTSFRSGLPRTSREPWRSSGVSRERVRQVELKTKLFLERYLSAFNQDTEETVADAA